MKKLALLFSLMACVCFADWAHVRDGAITMRTDKLPSSGTIIGTKEVVCGLQGADYAIQRACGWYPIVNTNAVPAGMMITATRETITATAVNIEHDYAPIPPRNYEISKYKLLVEIDKLQMFDQFDVWLDALPKKYKRLWDAATVLDSTNELVQAAMATLPTIMAVEPVTITNLLERAKADAR
jgi:hypothetical protein